MTPSATYSSGFVLRFAVDLAGLRSNDVRRRRGDASTELQRFALFIPDVYTGKFDNQATFREPTRLTANFQIAYEVTPRVRAVLTLTGLIDHCYQRGYAWDNAATCVYAQLPSNGQPPVGNFLDGTGLPTPPQLANILTAAGITTRKRATSDSGSHSTPFLNLEVRL